MFTNDKTSATIVALLTHLRESQRSHYYPRTEKVLQHQKRYRLQPNHTVHYPHGTNHHHALYSLGHGGDDYVHATQLTPQMMRDLRTALFHARQKKGTIHLFGVLDNDTPYGNFHLLESIVRFLLPSVQSLAIHCGVWSPTPREFRTNYQSLQSLAIRPEVRVTSLFPLSELQNEKRAEKFLDGLREDHRERVRISLPVKEPTFLSDFDVEADDIFIVPYTPSVYQRILVEALHNAYPFHENIKLNHAVPTHNSVDKLLRKSKHILVMANDPSYHEAYFGNDIHHPYFESIVLHSPTHLLEMLISPHFGYSSPPHRTVVLLNEERNPQFDWLLASYLRKNITSPLWFSWVTTDSLSDDQVYSNVVLPDEEIKPEVLLHNI